MTLLSTRKRAEDFDALVSGRPSDSNRHPELEELAAVVATLREHSPVAPRPDFAASLRAELLAEAATVLSADSKTLSLPTRRAGARERRLVAAATAVVVIGGTAGVAAASQSALPGDTLYPIKRTIERAEAGLNTDDAGKGEAILEQANDRLGEVQELLDQDAASPQVPATIDDFSEQAEQGAGLLIKSFEDDRDPAKIEQVRDFAASSLALLQELAKTAPPEAQEALADAALVLQSLDEQALGLCSQCASDLPPLQLATLLLSSSDLKQALEAAAAANVDNNRVKQDPASKPQPAEGDAATPGGSTKQDGGLPAVPDVTKAPVEETTKQLGETVDQTTDPVEELLDQVLPGAGGLVDGVTDGVVGPVLGGSTPTP
jgi:Domain of unknown function (DUF5667)